MLESKGLRVFPNPHKNHSQPGVSSCRRRLRCAPGTASLAFYTSKTTEYSQQTTGSCHQWFRSVVLHVPSRALQQCVCSDPLPQPREMSVSAHPKSSCSWGLMDHKGVLKLGPVGSLDLSQELLSPGSFHGLYSLTAQAQRLMLLLRPQLWARKYWTYKHNWMEGLEKRSSFVERGLVKLASEASTGIMWLQASCKAASPQSSRRRQGLHGSRSRLGSWCSSSRSAFPYMGKPCSNF